MTYSIISARREKVDKKPPQKIQKGKNFFDYNYYNTKAIICQIKKIPFPNGLNREKRYFSKGGSLPIELNIV